MRTRHLSLDGLFHLYWSIVHATVEVEKPEEDLCSLSEYKRLPWCFRKLVDKLINPTSFSNRHADPDTQEKKIENLEAKNEHLSDFIRYDSKLRLHPLVFMVDDSS